MATLRIAHVPWRAAFSLVELLVVLAVILVLAGMLFPTIRIVRESAKRATCAGNMRQIGMGVTAYREDTHAYPCGDPQWPWPTCVAGATVFALNDSYDISSRCWCCPDGLGVLAYTSYWNVPISEATARLDPFHNRAVTSYQYLANLPVAWNWSIRPGHDQANLALAGDYLATVNGASTGNHTATGTTSWDTGAFEGSWGGNELFIDGSVRWIPGGRTTGYWTNWATFRMLASE